MEVLTPAEEQAHYNAVLRGGTIWGATSLAGGLVGASALNRYWAGFRGLTLPLKAFAVTSVCTFSLIIGADRASRDFEDKALSASGIGWEDDALEHSLGLYDKSHELKRQRYQLMTGRARLLEHFKEYKYQYVLGSWAASMVGSFGFVATQPLPFTQKLVQARMYAQGLTVAVVLASAALASIPTSSEDGTIVEEAREKRDNAMYKFKTGSPHENQEKRLKELHKQEHHE
ncbi:hypothetical protein BY996DRAFT_8384577 [Phakopsora pachyrhizi]|nr:hypothetical protein BY996DRAFT_8384577 [Phakopsora pachyrhizi]